MDSPLPSLIVLTPILIFVDVISPMYASIEKIDEHPFSLTVSPLCVSAHWSRSSVTPSPSESF